MCRLPFLLHWAGYLFVYLVYSCIPCSLLFVAYTTLDVVVLYMIVLLVHSLAVLLSGLYFEIRYIIFSGAYGIYLASVGDGGVRGCWVVASSSVTQYFAG